MMPHHHPNVRMYAVIPDAHEGLAERTWPPGAKVEATVRVEADGAIEQLTVRCDVQTADGKVVEAGRYESVETNSWEGTVGCAGPAGSWCQVVAMGEAVFEDGTERPFILRSATWPRCDAGGACRAAGPCDTSVVRER